MNRFLIIPCIACAAFAAESARAQILDLSWRTVDCGGGEAAGESYLLSGAIGQADAGTLGGGGYEIEGGFWSVQTPQLCYANCDGSTATPVLNINDFICFQSRFAAGEPAANCDQSTSTPVLNVNDFICFQQRFATGCP